MVELRSFARSDPCMPSSAFAMGRAYHQSVVAERTQVLGGEHGDYGYQLGIDLHYANRLAHNVNPSDGGGDGISIQVEKVQLATLHHVNNAPV